MNEQRVLGNLTNSSGQVIVGYEYDAFGGLRSSSGSLTNDFRFTGEQSDAETGLVYLRARYYDSSAGRFITRDPFPGTIGNPASQNPYAYGYNNPVRHTDPSGEIALNLGLAALGSTVGAIIAGGQAYTGGERDLGKLATLAAVGGMSAAVTGFTFGVGSTLAAGAISAATANYVTQGITDEKRWTNPDLYSIGLSGVGGLAEARAGLWVGASFLVGHSSSA